MSHTMIARSFFGTTMGFHIIFATLGVGIPLMILAAELLYQRTGDRDYSVMARRWTKGFAVLLGIGIPTGTIAGVQLMLLWPGFMTFVGKVISLPFQIELYAFFIEALFMSIYVYAYDRLRPWQRIASVSLVTLGAMASAVLITNVHTFEDTPAGFKLVDGRITDVHPWQAFMNPSFVDQAVHVAVSAFMTGAFFIATIAAYKMLKQRDHIRIYTFHRKALMLSLAVGGIFSVLTALNGHETAQGVAQWNPEKLAAAEGLFETRTHAPLAIGGYVSEKDQDVKYALKIPGMLSFLVGNRFDARVKGLNDFPRDEWPPLFIHVLFNGMVGIGFLLLALSVIGFIWNKILRRPAFPKIMMWGFVASGPLAILGIEFGWIFACTGRQPWVIYRVMRTEEAVTGAGHLAGLFTLFLAVYIVLLIAALLVLYFLFRRHPVANDLPPSAGKPESL
jgi:cytochrome d ubiquinol oxidase subunit I